MIADAAASMKSSNRRYPQPNSERGSEPRQNPAVSLIVPYTCADADHRNCELATWLAVDGVKHASWLHRAYRYLSAAWQATSICHKHAISLASVHLWAGELLMGD